MNRRIDVKEAEWNRKISDTESEGGQRGGKGKVGGINAGGIQKTIGKKQR